ncbi:MAG: cupin domain-containing protein [Proteobacteria bacterium]|nr:cupin domain-containing protein [Pseudomonadota bacterium]
MIALLGLEPHPEGGHYRQTFRAPDRPRGASTAIYFLLKSGERSYWHKVDADEIWHYYAGAPLELSLSEDGRTVRCLRLGTDFDLGEQPQLVVPRGVWQAARSLGAWTLIGATVAPAFQFEGFEMAPRLVRWSGAWRRRALHSGQFNHTHNDDGSEPDCPE